jgi:hypothetical protein
VVRDGEGVQLGVRVEVVVFVITRMNVGGDDVSVGVTRGATVTVGSGRLGLVMLTVGTSDAVGVVIPATSGTPVVAGGVGFSPPNNKNETAMINTRTAAPNPHTTGCR